MIRTHVLSFTPFSFCANWYEGLEGVIENESYAVQCLAKAKEIRQHCWQKQSSLSCVCVGDFSWYSRIRQYHQWFGIYDKTTHTSVSDNQKPLLQQVGILPDAAQQIHTFKQNYTVSLEDYYDFRTKMSIPINARELSLQTDYLLQMLDDAQRLSYKAKLVILGPVSLLYSCQLTDPLVHYIPVLLRLYRQLLERVHLTGVEWIQFDEPICRLADVGIWQQIFLDCYLPLSQWSNRPKVLMNTCGAEGLNHMQWIYRLPLDAIHLDLEALGHELSIALQNMPMDCELSLGLIRFGDSLSLLRSKTEKAIETICKISPRRLWVGNNYLKNTRGQKMMDWADQQLLLVENLSALASENP